MRTIALFALLLLAACSGKPYVVKPRTEGTVARSHEVSVVSHGWHTGMILSGADLNDAIPELQERFGTPDYYEIGWGDKDFYQAQEITSGLTLQAMFWSQGAVLHVVALPGTPEHYFRGEPLVSICLSEQEFDSLKQYLAASFARNSAGRAIALRAGIYGESEFYDGEGRFHILNTCNKWTAKALSSSGLDLWPATKLTAGSVMSYLEAHPRECRLNGN